MSEIEQIVRRVLDEPTAEVVDWHAEGRQGGHRVQALAGTARVGEEIRSWYVVRKDVPGPGDAESQLHSSGVLADLPPGVRAPRCFGVEQTADGTVRLWLEHVHEDGDPHWSLDRWALAARHLGRFNGAYLAGRELPPAPSASPLRAILDRHAQLVTRIAAAPEDPAVRHWWPQPVVDAIVRLWEQRHAFCDALDRLPRTFCHGDAIRRNLLFQGDDLVAIDWEFAGLYAPGEEVGQTLSVAAAFFDWEPAELPALDEALFEAYLDGLGNHDRRQLRFAYCAHAALRNLFNAVGTSVPPEAGAAAALRNYGHTWDQLAGRRAMIRPFLLERADEARRLMEVL